MTSTTTKAAAAAAHDYVCSCSYSYSYADEGTPLPSGEVAASSSPNRCECSVTVALNIRTGRNFLILAPLWPWRNGLLGPDYFRLAFVRPLGFHQFYFHKTIERQN